MSSPRTVTVHTSDHGPVATLCPAWCNGREHQDGGYRIDITHASDDTEFNVDTPLGPITVMRACFEQHPFTEQEFPGREVFVNVELDGELYPCDPAQLHRVAAALTTHSVHMVTLATQLTELREAGR